MAPYSQPLRSSILAAELLVPSASLSSSAAVVMLAPSSSAVSHAACLHLQPGKHSLHCAPPAMHLVGKMPICMMDASALVAMGAPTGMGAARPRVPQVVFLPHTPSDASSSHPHLTLPLPELEAEAAWPGAAAGECSKPKGKALIDSALFTLKLIGMYRNLRVLRHVPLGRQTVLIFLQLDGL